MKIPNGFVPRAYHVSKMVYRKELAIKEGRELIVGEDKSINPNSANDYIYNFKSLLNGVAFTRKFNTFSMDYFVEHIYKDYGISGLSNALIALEGHIKYHKEKFNVNLNSMKKIIEKFSPKLNNDNDIIEQKEIADLLVKEQPNRDTILEELRNLKPSTSKETIIYSRTFTRDNATIEKLKYVRGYACQICSTKILKADGSFYIEAAHIHPKKDRGEETPENILILCPNHHKEFDYGKREILTHTAKEIVFRLNGKKYQVSLELV